MITDTKIEIRPLIYDWAETFWEMSERSPWWHKSINMQSSKLDWEVSLSLREKNVIGNILKGFAQTETEVTSYWGIYIPTWFPNNEIAAMATGFAAREVLHSRAYIYLNDTLGLQDFDGFLKEPSIAARLENLMNIGDNYANASLQEKAISVAIFSAGCEGVALFSAFSILLSFRNRKLKNGETYNKLTGVAEQMEWSIKDENLHSIAGCMIFRTLCAENKGLKEVVEQEVRDGMKLVVTLEEDYLDKIFEMGDIPTISKEEVLAFLYNRANEKFKELGYDYELYPVDEKLVKEMDWFNSVISSNKDNDFFASHSSAYSTSQGDWDF
jgi:ribonucleoside-diphosphate reductase beta chain